MAFTLCYITDRRAAQPKALPTLIDQAVRAGVDLVQIREKDLATRELENLVETAVEAARGSKTQILVNDRLDVALACGAAGGHLGTRSLPAEAARLIVPQGFLLGVSCHSLEEALAAEAASADYIVLGPIFETASKLAYGPPLGLATLRQVTARVRILVLALGGVTVERVKASLEAGASGIAGISIFQNCDSMEERVQSIRAQLP